MATRSRNSAGGLRRPSISLGFTPGGRQTLLQSLNTSAADEKAARNQEINDALEQIKNQGQDVIDGNMSIKDFMSAVSAAKTSFSEKSGTIATYANGIVRALDTNKFNDYMNGGRLADFKDYVDSRKGDGGGNTDSLTALWGKAQSNEDSVKFNSYAKGDITYDEFLKYSNDRLKSGGSTDKLGALVAQATTHENQLQDNNKYTMYNSGLIDGNEYTKYLNDRLQNEPNATVQTAIKTALKGVSDNEFSKQVNQAVLDYQMGKVGAAQTLIKLQGLSGQTNDAKLQAQIAQHINAIQTNERVTNGGGGSAAANRLSTEAKALYTEANTKFNTDTNNIDKQLNKATASNYAGSIQSILYSDSVYRAALTQASALDPYGEHKAFFDNLKAENEATQQQRLFTAYSTVAQNEKDNANKTGGTGGMNANPYAGATAEAKFWLQVVSKSSLLSPTYSERARQTGANILQTERANQDASSDGFNWQARVHDILAELESNPTAYKYLVTNASGAPNPNSYSSTPGYNEDFRDWLEKVLIGPNEDVVRQALAAGGIKGFTDMTVQQVVKGADGQPLPAGATGGVHDFTINGTTPDEWKKLLLNDGAASIRGLIGLQTEVNNTMGHRQQLDMMANFEQGEHQGSPEMNAPMPQIAQNAITDPNEQNTQSIAQRQFGQQPVQDQPPDRTIGALQPSSLQGGQGAPPYSMFNQQPSTAAGSDQQSAFHEGEHTGSPDMSAPMVGELTPPPGLYNGTLSAMPFGQVPMTPLPSTVTIVPPIFINPSQPPWDSGLDPFGEPPPPEGTNSAGNFDTGYAGDTTGIDHGK